MRRTVLALLLVALVGLAAAGLARPGSADAVSAAPPARAFEDHEPRDCSEYVPAGVAVGSASVGFDLLVLLDGISPAAAARAMAVVAEVYDPIGIRVVAVRYETVELRTRVGRGILDEARAHVGGVRPPGIDSVLVLTSKDITDDGFFGPALAGVADCIGGVKYPEYGFVVAEAGASPADDARIAAHELGHAAGAHHHYANCVEAVTAFEPFRPCTVMINDIGLAALTFSSVNGSMLRYHLDEYARP